MEPSVSRPLSGVRGMMCTSVGCVQSKMLHGPEKQGQTFIKVS